METKIEVDLINSSGNIAGPGKAVVDIARCIICQKDSCEPLRSSDHDRKRVREASDIRSDVVLKRLKLITSDSEFSYHVTNDCYKKYTMNKTLERIKVKQSDNHGESEESAVKGTETLTSPLKSRRSQSLPRSMPGDHTERENMCVICGNAKYAGVYKKFRISEEGRAEKFLKATQHFQDSVYTRTCDLQDAGSVFGADLYAHKACSKRYIKAYEDDLKTTQTYSKMSPQLEHWCKIEPTILEGLASGKGYSLTDIRHMLNESLPSEHRVIRNSEIKIIMLNRLGDKIKFTCSQSSGKKQSVMVYSNSITVDQLIDSVREDPVTQCANILREELMKVDFALDDRFCDAHELRHSWENMVIPDSLKKFFGVLFNVDMSDYQQWLNDNANGEAQNDEADADMEDSSYGITDAKMRQILALFQIMVYDIHRGRKRTPLHVMNSQIIYELCKSATLLNLFNHLGLGISYDEILRYHFDLCMYTISQGGEVPFPSHFDPGAYTTAAFDNFDHLEATTSGMNSSHDTVMVLFQDDTKQAIGKPNISDTPVVHGPKNLNTTLPCQNRLEYFRPAVRPSLSENYVVSNEIFVLGGELGLQALKKDMGWSLARLELSDNVNIKPEVQIMPSWSATNSLLTSETMGVKTVAFLPVIPNPVTEHSTVYSALVNFKHILKKLNQAYLAVACDEAVYAVAREIMMARTGEFKDIVLVMGSFHMAKVVLGCLGKYIAGGGADTIWIESEVFGPNVVHSVMNGGHYVRSLKGMFYLYEAMRRLQWEAFFTANGTEKYESCLKTANELRDAVTRKDRQASTTVLDEWMANSDVLRTDFEQFISNGRENSETFKYWDTYLNFFCVLLNLIRADREGLFELHLDSVQQSQKIFAALDATNYLRWSSLYLEDMRRLPVTAPETHQAFMEGHFVVKRTPGKFRAVGLDMCLEQTINRSMKGSGGIIGSTRKKNSVAEWEIVYHEMLAVSNLHREKSGVKKQNHDLDINHEFSSSETKAGERSVQAMITYIQQHENPFSSEENPSGKLHNILTHETATDAIRLQLLEVEQIGHDKYMKHRQDRFISKTVKISDTIHRTNLQTLKHMHKTSSQKTKTKRAIQKESGSMQKVLDVAQSRGHTMESLLAYDVSDQSALFDENGFMKKAVKSNLMIELEKHLSKDDYTGILASGPLITTYLVDVMPQLRMTSLKDLDTFGDFVIRAQDMIVRKTPQADGVHFCFDSPETGSIKDSERQRRSSPVNAPIEVQNLQLNTPLSKDMSLFWPLNENKISLEKLLYESTKQKATDENIAPEIILGTIQSDPPLKATKITVHGCQHEPQLDTVYEEADMSLVVHANHAVDSGTTRLVVLSPDTDPSMHMLYYWDHFHKKGLQELWVKTLTKHIPLHTLARKLGYQLCKVLIAVHNITGADYTSKVGTKLSALKAKPTSYLQQFGKLGPTKDFEEQLSQAEAYICQVLKPGTALKSVNKLRSWLYYHSKSTTLQALPPSGSSLRAHICRSYYVTNQVCSILTDTPLKLDPADYGYGIEDGLLLPVNILSSLPEKMTTYCNCRNCATQRCSCRKLRLKCCKFCKCTDFETTEGHTGCKNPLT